jgi:hypothetical protein
MAGMKVCLCHKLAELSHVRPKNLHAQRCACFTKTNLEHKQNSTSKNICLINIKSHKITTTHVGIWPGPNETGIKLGDCKIEDSKIKVP